MSFEQECCNYGFYYCLHFFCPFLHSQKQQKTKFCDKACTIQRKTVERKCVEAGVKYWVGVHSFKSKTHGNCKFFVHRLIISVHLNRS